MEIKASMVKELRDKTGAGMMDAKKALVEANGDVEKAMEVLRQKGMASADKKMGRIAAEGAVASVVEGKIGAMVEVNCETDFVAKNDDFKEFASMMARAVAKLNPASVDELLTMECPECKKQIEEVIKEKIAKIGEKITTPCCPAPVSAMMRVLPIRLASRICPIELFILWAPVWFRSSRLTYSWTLPSLLDKRSKWLTGVGRP